jgi:hypothetical protein
VAFYNAYTQQRRGKGQEAHVTEYSFNMYCKTSFNRPIWREPRVGLADKSDERGEGERDHRYGEEKKK